MCPYDNRGIYREAGFGGGQRNSSWGNDHYSDPRSKGRYPSIARPEPKADPEKLQEQAAALSAELVQKRIAGHAVFKGVELLPPDAKNPPWRFIVSLDNHEVTEAEISGYRRRGDWFDSHAFFEDATKTVKTLIQAHTPHMRGLNHYRIELSRR